MGFLTSSEKQTLIAICDTLMPPLAPSSPQDDPQLFGTGAVELGVPDLLEDALERVAEPSVQRNLKGFLRMLEVGAVNWVTTGRAGAFSKLELADRAAVLRAWSNSPLSKARSAFQSIKRLALFLTYAAQPEAQTNPTWACYNYPDPPPKPAQPKYTFDPLLISKPTELQADVVIIGSGAGGGVVAGELAAAGWDVLIMEKGSYYNEATFPNNELQGNALLYEKQGAMTTDDLSMVVMAGSTLGGGTTINWMASFRTPDDVLHEWEHVYGFDGATSAAYQHSLDAVSQRINVNTDESIPNVQNSLLEKGVRELGYDIDVIPRNVRACQRCDFCNFGCVYGAKQGMLTTYLQDAVQHGARVLTRSYVDEVTHQYGRVTGVVATSQGTDGRLYQVRVKAPWVVVAAGAVHTPAILKRSGLENSNIGKHLHLHPVTTTTGYYEDPVRAWEGAPMTRLFNAEADLDGRGYGYRIEVPPVHPGMFASVLPWQSSRQHRRLLSRMEHYANFIVLTRDYYGGQIKVNKQGKPQIHYALHPYDAKHLMRGMLQSLRLHRAAGAQIIYNPHNQLIPHYTNGQASFDQYLKRIEKKGFPPNDAALFSAHQMSSCRIAGDSERGGLQPTGESYEIRGLFVADGSVLPTASGVNPMLSIMGAAHFIAQHIKLRG